MIKVIQTETSRDFQNQREGRVLKFLFRGHNCWFRPEKWFQVTFCRTFVVSFALEFFQFNPRVCFHYARAWGIMWLTRTWRLSIRTVALHLRRLRTCQGFLREFQYTALQQKILLLIWEIKIVKYFLLHFFGLFRQTARQQGIKRKLIIIF